MNNEEQQKPSLAERLAGQTLAELENTLKNAEAQAAASNAIIQVVKPLLATAKRAADIATLDARGELDASDIRPLEVGERVLVPHNNPFCAPEYQNRKGRVSTIAHNGNWGSVGVRLEAKLEDPAHYHTNVFVFDERALMRIDDEEEGGLKALIEGELPPDGKAEQN